MEIRGYREHQLTRTDQERHEKTVRLNRKLLLTDCALAISIIINVKLIFG
ncbi:hypothetical protein [Sporolactobacillus sp. THM19-2]|nr:hypothetical protein [Sporolactobacillus sp. THM19-2]